MSFSAKVKNEMCRVPMMKDCCMRAEAYGMLLNASAFSHREMRLSTEHEAVARRIRALISRTFSIDCAPRQAGKKTSYTIDRPQEISRVFAALGYDMKSHVTYHLNRNVLEDDCCLISFLRGAFLMAGTVAGPDKKSHLEMVTPHPSLAGEEMSLLLDLHLTPKQTVRRSAHVLYFKDGASAEDFLTMTGAPHAAMELMEAKVEKNIRNTVNRQVNCETANLMKATDASARQVAAIHAALQKHGDGFFPEKLRETVKLRLQYPTDSLTELAARFDPPISKPGLSHRLRKITELAQSEEI